MIEKPKKVIGRADLIDLPEQGFFGVPAKIDTGAETSSIWATNVHERDGGVAFTLFDQSSPRYTGNEHFVTDYEQVMVASSNGAVQPRYKVALLLKILGRRIR